MKLSRIASFFLICLLYIIGITPSEAGSIQGLTDKEIKVGLIQCTSGPIGPDGQPLVNGVTDYFKYVNEQGGIHGRKIKLYHEDDQFQTPKALAAFNKLWFRDKIFTMVAEGGVAQTLALLPQMARHNLVSLVGGGSQAYVEPFNPTLFLPQASYKEQIFVMFDYIVNDLGDKKPEVGIVYAETQFGKDGLMAARERAKQYGVKLVAELVLPMFAVDATSQVLSLKKAGAKYVLNCSYATAMVSMFKACDDLGYYPYLLAINLQTDDFLFLEPRKSAEKFIGVHFFHMWNEDVPIMGLARKIFKKYDREPTTRQNYYTWGFGIAKVFEEGLKRAGRDLTLDKLRAGLESLKQYKDSPYAPLTFTSTNHKGSSTLNVVKADVKTKRFISLGWRDPLELQ